MLRPLYGRGHLDQVLATFGLIMFFNELVVMIWGRVPLNIDVPPLLPAMSIFAGRQLSGLPPRHHRRGARLRRVLLYVSCRTRLGALIRAGADNREIVEALGVNIGCSTRSSSGSARPSPGSRA